MRASLACLQRKGTKDTKGTKAAGETESIWTRSHHQIVGVVRVQGTFPDWDPSVPFVPFVPSW